VSNGCTVRDPWPLRIRAALCEVPREATRLRGKGVRPAWDVPSGWSGLSGCTARDGRRGERREGGSPDRPVPSGVEWLEGGARGGTGGVEGIGVNH